MTTLFSSLHFHQEDKSALNLFQQSTNDSLWKVSTFQSFPISSELNYRTFPALSSIISMPSFYSVLTTTHVSTQIASTSTCLGVTKVVVLFEMNFPLTKILFLGFHLPRAHATRVRFRTRLRQEWVCKMGGEVPVASININLVQVGLSAEGDATDVLFPKINPTVGAIKEDDMMTQRSSSSRNFGDLNPVLCFPSTVFRSLPLKLSGLILVSISTSPGQSLTLVLVEFPPKELRSFPSVTLVRSIGLRVTSISPKPFY